MVDLMLGVYRLFILLAIGRNSQTGGVCTLGR